MKMKNKKVAIIVVAAIVLIAIIILLSVLFAPQPPRKLSCAELEATIRQQIKYINYCNDDSDCVSEYLDCPFGCAPYFNKIALLPKLGGTTSPLEDIKRNVKEYKANCDQCEYICAITKNPVCVNEKCVAPNPSVPV